MSEKSKIHVSYVIAILLAVIVLLLTVKWGSIPELVSYVSFALTGASLLLAIVAIAYSIYSGNSLTSVLSQLSGSSKQIGESSQNIAEVATELAKEVGRIPELIEGVGRRVEETHTLLLEYSERESQATTDTKAAPPTSSALETFLKRGSLLGTLALYAFHRAYIKKAAFDLQKLCAAVPKLRRDYTYGYVVASIAAGALKGRGVKGIWNVTDFDETIAESLGDTLDSKIEKLESSAIKEAFQEAKDDIDGYFG